MHQDAASAGELGKRGAWRWHHKDGIGNPRRRVTDVRRPRGILPFALVAQGDTVVVEDGTVGPSQVRRTGRAFAGVLPVLRCALQGWRLICRDAGGIWRKANAAVDASRGVGCFGDDDPAIATRIGGPQSGEAEEVRS